VTLCIAAPYEAPRADGKGNDAPAVVICVDSLAVLGESAGAVSVTDTDKIRWITPNTTLLIAGQLSAADGVVGEVAPAIRQYEAANIGTDPDLYVDGLLKVLKECMQRRKAVLVDEHFKLHHGFSFNEFREKARERFTEGHYIELWNEVRQIHLAADTIVITFAGDEAVIIRTDVQGGVHWEEHYATIGTGSSIANAFLAQRDYYEYGMVRDECVYRVFEAKIAAERNVYVGSSTSIFILRENGALAGFDYDGEGPLRDAIRQRLRETPEHPIDNKHFTPVERPKRLRG